MTRIVSVGQWLASRGLISFLMLVRLVLCESAADCKDFIISSVLGTFAGFVLLCALLGAVCYKRRRRRDDVNERQSVIVLSKDNLVGNHQDGLCNDALADDNHVISNESVVPINDALEMPLTGNHAPEPATRKEVIHLQQSSKGNTFGVSVGIAGLYVKDLTDNHHMLSKGDEVVSINGICVRDMTDSEALSLLARAGCTVTMEVKRGVFAKRAMALPCCDSCPVGRGQGVRSDGIVRHPSSARPRDDDEAVVPFDQRRLPSHHGNSLRRGAMLNTSASMPSLNIANNNSDETTDILPLAQSPKTTASVDCLATARDATDENSNSLELSVASRAARAKCSSAVFFSDIDLVRQQALFKPFDVNLSRAKFPAPTDAAASCSNGYGSSAPMAVNPHDQESIGTSDYSQLAMAQVPPPSPGDDASALAFAMSVSRLHQAKAAANAPANAHHNRPQADQDQERTGGQIQIDPDVMREMMLKYSEPRFPLVLPSSSIGSGDHGAVRPPPPYHSTEGGGEPNGTDDCNVSPIDSPSDNIRKRHITGSNDGGLAVHARELDRLDRERMALRANWLAQGSLNDTTDTDRPRCRSTNNDATAPPMYTSMMRSHSKSVAHDYHSASQQSPAARPRRTAKIANPRSASFLKPRRQPKRAHSLPPRQEHANDQRAALAGAWQGGKASQVMFDSLDSINRRKSIDSGTLKKLHGELKANPSLCSEYPIIAQLLGHTQPPADDDDARVNEGVVAAQYRC